MQRHLRVLRFHSRVPAKRRGMHPVVKIFLESVLVFGLCLGLYFIIREL